MYSGRRTKEAVQKPCRAGHKTVDVSASGPVQVREEVYLTANLLLKIYDGFLLLCRNLCTDGFPRFPFRRFGQMTPTW